MKTHKQDLADTIMSYIFTDGAELMFTPDNDEYLVSLYNEWKVL